MGKSYSKEEEKPVIIAQSGGGTTNVITSDLETHLNINNCLITAALVVLAIILIYAGCRKYKKAERTWIEERIQNEFIRRMRERISGRLPTAGGVPAQV